MALVALQRPRSGQLEQALSTLEQLSQGAAVSREHLASPEYSDPAAVAIRGPLSLTAGTQSPPPVADLSTTSSADMLVAQAAQPPAPPTSIQGEAAQEQPAGTQPPVPAPAAEAPAGLIGPVQIEWLEGLDVLIIRGHERDVQRVAELIQEIERLSAEIVPVIQIHQLRHVNCEPLITVLTQIYQQVYQPRLGSVLILALVKPNAILVAGRQESVQAVIDLAQQLDRPVRPETQFRIFRLRHAPADQVAQTVSSFYEDRAGLGTRVRVSTDFRSNSLIVEASPRDMAEVSELVAQLDTSHAEAQSEIRVFKLKNTLATELATILQNAITGQAYGVRAVGQVGVAAAAQQQQQQERKSAVLRFVTINEKGRRTVSSGILTDAVITADARSNSLLVTASPDSMPLIAALIEELDQLPTAEAQIKVFTLVNGDAQDMAEMLQAIFGQQQQVAAQQVAIRTGAQPGESALVPLRFAVDIRTNSIIASGTAGDLALVEAILLRLDGTEVRARMNRVFRLKNSPANDVANALNEFLRSERQLLQIAPGVVSAFEQIEREVVIVPEPVSNSLIVSATPRFYEDVIRLVEELDARPPMVMIQVLIAELSLGNTDEFGVELGLQDSILFDRSVAGTGTLAGTNIPGFLFNTTDPLGNSNSAAALAQSDRIGTQGITNFSLGRGSPELGFGGLVLSASSESVSVLIRALRESRRLEILSRPQIMTMDNMMAQILVGQEVPTISGTQFTDLGGQINTITWREVGLILTVTPRISPDRLVVMEIDATKSEVGPEAEGIPVSVSQGQVIRAPRINTTSARTVISAADGETVVLGGLITKTKAHTQRKVPVLGDIPLVGRLFRYDAMRDNRTELLIIMTPHIVQNEADVERIKQIESARMDWCLRDVMELHGANGLQAKGCEPPAAWEVKIRYPQMEQPAPEGAPAEVIPSPPAIAPQDSTPETIVQPTPQAPQ
jgi:type II secretion system protein D